MRIDLAKMYLCGFERCVMQLAISKKEEEETQTDQRGMGLNGT